MNTNKQIHALSKAKVLFENLIKEFTATQGRMPSVEHSETISKFACSVHGLPENTSLKETTEKEFWPPVDGITVAAFEALIKAHDFYYGYSDDNSVWRRGEEELKVINDHIAKNPKLAKVWTDFCKAKDASSNAAISASKAADTPKAVLGSIAALMNKPAVELTVLEDWFFREPDTLPLGTLNTPIGMQIRYGEDGITSPIVSFDGSKKTITTKSGNTYRLGYVLYTKCYVDRIVLSAVGF
jgi:hypothetical protein